MQRAEEGCILSEEKFTRVFRSSLIAFSITTVEDGRFIDVNNAFEHRYGYARQELIGRTVSEIGVWDASEERSLMVGEVRKLGQLRNRVTRFLTRSGGTLETLYSANIIELEEKSAYWRFPRPSPVLQI